MLSVWCQGGPANNWRYETLIEPPPRIWVLPVPGPSRFMRVPPDLLADWPEATAYDRMPGWEQFDFERIYYSDV